MKTYIFIFLLPLYLFFHHNCLAQKQATLSGYVEDASTGEKLIGASIYNSNLSQGTSTNAYGFYSITLPPDSIKLIVRYIGYEPQFFTISLKENKMVNFKLKPGTELKTVEIIAPKEENITERSQMSAIEIPISQIKNIPALLGEVDVLKALQLLPGVQSGGEGSSGFYVRGGGPDQNLILLDGAPVYNASHLFGFFSVFNADAINNIQLIKGGFPARYGGRLSSVLDINMKEGNTKKFHGEGSIGIVASRLTLEGPIIKDKTSFIISARRTYIDVLARPLIKSQMQGNGYAGYYFYDVNAKINHKFSDKDRIYLSAYMGDDRFYFVEKSKSETINDKSQYRLGWGNITSSFRWNHVITPKIFSNVGFTYSKYKFYTTQAQETTENGNSSSMNLNYSSGIQDWSTKIDLDYIPNPNHFIKFGANHIYHTFNTGATQYKTTGENENNLDNETKNNLYANEFAAYVEDDIKLTDALKINAGVHTSGFLVKNTFYPSVQPRISARYLLPNNWAVKASYATMAQYIHLLTNSGIGLPTDLWVPVTDKVKPQTAQQYATGVTKMLLNNQYEFTLEGYYKTMDHIIDFLEGANFMQTNTDWQQKIEEGKGYAYGAELFLQRKEGKLTGWIGYTLSWTNRKFPTINSGKTYPYKYDRRHDFELVLNYDINERINVAGTWVYGTGNAISMPLATYSPAEGVSPYGDFNYYGDKNNVRMPAYHRLDLGVSFKKKKRWGERSWTIGVYNAYSRMNPFYIYVDTKEGSHERVIKQGSLFPILPSISYNFKF